MICTLGFLRKLSTTGDGMKYRGITVFLRWYTVGQFLLPRIPSLLCATIVHSAMHTHMNRPNSSLD